MPRSILIVAQHAPPSPLVGARRPAALAKELGRRGHRVTILTSLASGAGPIEGAATIRSRDLLSTRLNWRRESLQAMQGARPGRYREASPLQSLVVPDLSLITWLPFLLPRALQAAAALRPDCVITTGPPQSAHLVGLVLRRRGVPWIADLRDGWTFDPPHPPWPSRCARRPRCLAGAQRAAGRGPSGRRHRADRSRSARPSRPPSRGDHQRLRSRRGARRRRRWTARPRALLAGAHGAPDRLGRQRPDAARGSARAAAAGDPRGARRLEVVLAGATSEAQDRLVADPRYADVARPVGVLDRPAALALQRAADALVVLAAGMPGRPSTSVATGKLFEYLAAGAPRARARRADRGGPHRGAGRSGRGGGRERSRIRGRGSRAPVDAPPEPNRAAVGPTPGPPLAERYEQVIEAACRQRDSPSRS